MIVRKVTKSEIVSLVRVHQEAFPHFFLTTLGNRFLRLYYDSVRTLGDGILLAAFTDDSSTCLGFCAATVRSAGFNRRLISSRLFAFLVQGIFLGVTRFPAVIRLAKNMRKTNLEVDDPGEYAELLSIAVSPVAQGTGVGSRLLNALIAELTSRNATELSLTTDVCENDATIGFYSKNGFREYYRFTAYPDRKMYRLNRRIEQ